MNNLCENCEKPTTDGNYLCDACLHSWSVMRRIIRERQTDQFGEANVTNQDIMMRDFRRLELAWRNNRRSFVNETNQWYKPKPTE